MNFIEITITNLRKNNIVFNHAGFRQAKVSIDFSNKKYGNQYRTVYSRKNQCSTVFNEIIEEKQCSTDYEIIFGKVSR